MGKIGIKWKENHATKVTKIPKNKRQKYGMNKPLIKKKNYIGIFNYPLYYLGNSDRFTWYHVIFQTGSRDGVAFLFCSTTTVVFLGNK